MKFQTPYGFQGHKGLFFEKPSMTKQEFKDECDITNIIDKFTRTGELSTPLTGRDGIFADVSNIPDYATSQNVLCRINEWFGSLPSGLRARFDNDPSKLLQFVNDPANKDEAEKLGLLASSDKSNEFVHKSPVQTSEGEKVSESDLALSRGSSTQNPENVTPNGAES